MFCQEVKKKLQNSDDYKVFLKCLHIYSKEIISANDLKDMVASLVGDDEYLTSFIESNKIFVDERLPAYLQGTGENPSYRPWPENRPMPSTSQRTDFGAKLLNDYFICKSTLRDEEDNSFKNPQKNKYEERRRKLIEDHLTNRYLWLIELLYGEHGMDVVDVLKENSNVALPVILARLKQKQNELSAYCLEYSKVMAEIRSRNYEKSLDHRSFNLEKQDTQHRS
ncbi:hypothetical protein MKW94_001128 [Papaver nudicaule]|uniref:Histone deacetylase interacting domain-containing protein n=1 Tax=Papaver nudicaule TaxID=74823 RepID=A0AA41VQF2_PAPNU|nr:hypothetical protein [Papaver nudicaule]